MQMVLLLALNALDVSPMNKTNCISALSNNDSLNVLYKLLYSKNVSWERGLKVFKVSKGKIIHFLNRV